MNQANMIGKGAQAEVYLHKNKAMKIFYDKPREDVEYEARLQELANKNGLPVPAVYKVVTIGGRNSIIMEYIDGQLQGNIILNDLGNLPCYIERVVELQIKMHQLTGDDFPKMKKKYKTNIKAAGLLKSGQKRKLLFWLNRIKFSNHLCHGDFHLMNLIQTNTQDIFIIDWANACSGSPIADVCNTFLIFILISDELAQLYLNLYCEKSNVTKEEIFYLIPLVACTKLSENIPEKDIEYLLKIVNDHLNTESLWRKLWFSKWIRERKGWGLN